MSHDSNTETLQAAIHVILQRIEEQTDGISDDVSRMRNDVELRLATREEVEKVNRKSTIALVVSVIALLLVLAVIIFIFSNGL